MDQPQEDPLGPGEVPPVQGVHPLGEGVPGGLLHLADVVGVPLEDLIGADGLTALHALAHVAAAVALGPVDHRLGAQDVGPQPPAQLDQVLDHREAGGDGGGLDLVLISHHAQHHVALIQGDADRHRWAAGGLPLPVQIQDLLLNRHGSAHRRGAPPLKDGVIAVVGEVEHRAPLLGDDGGGALQNFVDVVEQLPPALLIDLIREAEPEHHGRQMAGDKGLFVHLQNAGLAQQGEHPLGYEPAVGLGQLALLPVHVLEGVGQGVHVLGQAGQLVAAAQLHMDLPLPRRQPLHPVQGPAQAQRDPAQDGQRQGGEQHRQGGQALDHPPAVLLSGRTEAASGHVHSQQKVPLALVEQIMGLAPPGLGPELEGPVWSALRLRAVKAGARLRPDPLRQTGVALEQGPDILPVPLIDGHGGVLVEAAPRLGQAVPQPLGQGAVRQLQALEGLGRGAAQKAVRLPRGGLPAQGIHRPPHQNPGAQRGHRRRQKSPAHQHGQPEPPLLPQHEPQQGGQHQHPQGQSRQDQAALDRRAVEHPGEIGHRAPPVQQQALPLHQQQDVPVPGHPQVGTGVQVIGLLLQVQNGIGLPVGKIRKVHLQAVSIHIVHPGARLGQTQDQLPLVQGDGLSVRPNQAVPVGQDQRAVGQGQGGPQAGLHSLLARLQAAARAGALVELGRIPLDQSKGHHIVHLREVGQAGARHLLLEVLPRACLVQEELRLPALIGQAVELEPGVALRVVEPQVDRSPRRRVENGRGAVPGDRPVLQRPALGPPAGQIADDQLIALLRASQGIDAPLRIGGGQEVIALSRPGREDGTALRSQVPEQQNRASAQNGQKRHKNSYFLQSVHLPHLRFRRAAQCRKCPQSRAHQRRKKLRFSSFS